LVDVWPGIRDGVEQVGRAVTDDLAYANNVLAALLSGRFQIWIALNETREIFGFLVTRVGSDSLSADNYLNIELVYGLRKSTPDVVFEVWEKLKEFALAYNCEFIKATTNIERAMELLELVGAREVSRNYSARIK